MSEQQGTGSSAGLGDLVFILFMFFLLSQGF